MGKGQFLRGAMYCVLVFIFFLQIFHFNFVSMGVVMYELVQDMEIVFCLCNHLTICG